MPMMRDDWWIEDPTHSPGLETIRRLAPWTVNQACQRPPWPCKEHKELRSESKLDQKCTACRESGYRWFAELFRDSAWYFIHNLNAADALALRLSKELEDLRSQDRAEQNNRSLALVERLEAERDEWRRRALAAESVTQ